MCSLRRITVLALIMAVLFLPMATYAQDPKPWFYASDTGSANGTGRTGATARLVQVSGSYTLGAACRFFVEEWERIQGSKPTAGQIATVYWYRVHSGPAHYLKYRLDHLGVCSPTDDYHHNGKPPDWGVTITPPVLVGGLVASGVVLLVAAWLLSRRRRISLRSV